MKVLFLFTVAALLTATGASYAQVAPQPSLADVARAEEARRKTAKKAKVVITNGNLSAADLSGIAGTTNTPSTSAPVARPAPEPEEEKPADAGNKKDQKYWQERISGARSDLSRTQLFAESMQTRVNSLKNDIFNLDYPARGVAEKQLNTTLAELERLKKEIEAKTKGIAAIEEEARRAGVPPGWLRP